MSENKSIYSLKERIVSFVTDVIYERNVRESRLAAWIAFFLGIFSILFKRIVLFRFFLYRTRIFHDTPLGCKVVVVGNLTVGGTGKTPVVERMARVMAKKGRKVAILSRGYKSKKESMLKRFIRWITNSKRPAPRVVCNGKEVLLPADVAGDEPYMLAKNLVKFGVVIVVDRDRVYAGAYAIKHFGVDIIILDDGLQYLPLRGSINLLLVDKNNPFGNRQLLPRGILREPVEHLSRGTYIFITKSNGVSDDELKKEIKKYNSKAEIIECTHKPKFYMPYDDKHPILNLEDLSGDRVATFSGIATPDKFEEFVRLYGARIAYNRRFFDHHSFSKEDLEEVFAGAKLANAEYIITTEKDIVRLAKDLEPPVPIYYLRLEVEIISGEETFSSAVERICS